MRHPAAGPAGGRRDPRNGAARAPSAGARPATAPPAGRPADTALQPQGAHGCLETSYAARARRDARAAAIAAGPGEVMRALVGRAVPHHPAGAAPRHAERGPVRPPGRVRASGGGGGDTASRCGPGCLAARPGGA
ncbi:acyl-CoA dehydrogenase family protein [Streptomyces sp. NPDC006975]|uniref:acyl-CoA dehydrogenase family protein n=1 Tax=Streptomyces sp. NPDC006975 TaxID=3154310 RepID=UPI003452833F